MLQRDSLFDHDVPGDAMYEAKTEIVVKFKKSVGGDICIGHGVRPTSKYRKSHEMSSLLANESKQQDASLESLLWSITSRQLPDAACSGQH